MMVLPDKCLPSVWEEVEALKPHLPHHRKHPHWHGRQQQFGWVNDITYSYEGDRKSLLVHGVGWEETWQEIDPKSGELIDEQTQHVWLSSQRLDPYNVHERCNLGARQRWGIAVSSQGHINQSVKVRPRLKDSGLVAWEALWRESKTVEPSDNILEREYKQRTRLQRAVNAEVASLHATPVAETVDNARRQQGLGEMSPMRQPSPAGYQRRHGTKENVSTGEARGARRGKLVEEASPITVSGKWRRRHPGDGSGRSTVDGRAAKRARREGPGPVSTPLVKVRQG
jgi:hypothetical protein